MSTFNGKVKEFPDIRIDHFRLSGEVSRPPLAFFLSHVHSDHLEGLESCKSPFIYCSPATKAILLRLEKYPHRMNFAKGILETRKQTYKHLKKLLKIIPLETPTTLGLAPGRSIRVTLFDANHCVGAVSFLVEGDGKAILYTGDIRSELWWVNNLARHPLMLPYASDGGKKRLKQLDCIYLDTTFANNSKPYKHFPTKAEGTLELLQKVSKYPKGTVFYFDTWTFGYEDVWMSLCGFLDCQVHVDEYRYGLYRALGGGDGIKAEETARLSGYICGNHEQQGCLTREQTRLHSCEQGTGCEVFEKGFVRITPIISRHEGVEMAELGAGGGKGDLDQQHELEIGDYGALTELMSLCATKLQDQPKLLSGVLEMLSSLLKDPTRVITLDPSELLAVQPGSYLEDFSELEQIPLDRLIPALTSLAAKAKDGVVDSEAVVKIGPQENPSTFKTHLPKRITFPYSRHSSHTELCYLIEAFKPRDIWPCTVDKANWTAAQSMGMLFGHIYGGHCKFTHDQMMLARMPRGAVVPESRPMSPGGLAGEPRRQDHGGTSSRAYPEVTIGPSLEGVKPPGLRPQDTSVPETDVQLSRKRRRSDEDATSENRPAYVQHCDSDDQTSPQGPLLSPDTYAAAWKQEAHEAALGSGSIDWNDITLTSVSGHQEREHEL